MSNRSLITASQQQQEVVPEANDVCLTEAASSFRFAPHSMRVRPRPAEGDAPQSPAMETGASRGKLILKEGKETKVHSRLNYTRPVANHSYRHLTTLYGLGLFAKGVVLVHLDYMQLVIRVHSGRGRAPLEAPGDSLAGGSATAAERLCRRRELFVTPDDIMGQTPGHFDNGCAHLGPGPFLK